MIDAEQINIAVLQRFNRLVDNHRLAHAYLLLGPKGSGKTQTARALAQLVNCEGIAPKPCGRCPACRKIASGNHPDVHIIGSDEEGSIKIEDIRFLLGRAALMAFEAKTKVFIIRHIEMMTLDAANALLKTLEEPAPNTLMVLTTSLPEANLDTIKSRCHVVKFFPSPVNRVARHLMNEGLEMQDARFLAFYAQGCLGKARQLMDGKVIQERRKILDEMLLNRYNDTFLKGLSADPLQTALALQLLLGFFRDVLLLKNGVAEAELLHQDRLKELKVFAARSIEDIGTIIGHIVWAKKLVDENLNVKMSLSLLREHLWDN
ncbi:MAG: AAA family ATPase [Candidatus Omnitrophica bacterium]|nr:AAA family ATPase [Candidatus Omnitrophota bacterium]MDE2008468.1 AAA family ATPase [Candidatus Omnitrophota bacterium]MDE2214806.1 AAA family ATPase [Candidatus Omnitrophota bacterium]MDE2231411.1 AAA family ATPase [Candidatus Omnitrophota bacterium]